jgi:hypothetical protein
VTDMNFDSFCSIARDWIAHPGRATGHERLATEAAIAEPLDFMSEWWKHGWPEKWPSRRLAGRRLSRIWKQHRGGCGPAENLERFRKVLRAVKRPRQWVDRRLGL